jgi:myo-inositol 2-dehydrogenase/D-chiro-inositol 1-dehydrogenase
VPAWTIFLETLIHDFDTLNWFNEGAEPVEVYAVADALVEPSLREQGFLDTAVVTIRYSNGAIAVAEANFSALYGYDVRGEVFGSKGMVQAGRSTETAALRYTAEGLAADTPRLNVELFSQAYTDELADFAAAVRAKRDGGPSPSSAFTLTPVGADARRALAVALACIESVKSGAPVAVAERAGV